MPYPAPDLEGGARLQHSIKELDSVLYRPKIVPSRDEGLPDQSRRRAPAQEEHSTRELKREALARNGIELAAGRTTDRTTPS